MPPFPEWIGSFTFPAIGFIASLLSFLVAALMKHRRDLAVKMMQAEAKKQIEKLRSSLKALEAVPLEERPLVQQVLSTSGAQAPVGIAEGNAALAELRQQISVIEQQVRAHRNEIVEVAKIDPVLEATIKASIDNLTKRIEFLEKTRLEKWDVAIVFFQLFGSLGVVFGIVFAIIKYLHP